MLTKEQKALKSAYIDAVITESFGENMRKYFNQSIDRVVELHDGRMIAVEKPSIHKQFCFGWHSTFPGADYKEAGEMAEYAGRSEVYFIEENMKQIDRKIEDLSRDRIRYTPKSAIQYLRAGENSRVCYLKWCDKFDCGLDEKDTDRDMTDGDIEKLRAAYLETKRDFGKRLDTYLKRYGMKHVRTWTYWADE